MHRPPFRRLGAVPRATALAVAAAAMVTACAAFEAGPAPAESAGAAAPVSATVRPLTTPPSSGPPRLDVVPALEVLRAWDQRRARAFATGDVAALLALYDPGSAAGTADAELLRAYRSRGLRVRGMRMQILAVDVLLEERQRIRLRVTDRLAAGVAVGDATRMPLPRDAASTSVVELVRRGAHGSWRVVSVRESAPRRAGH